MFIVLIAFAIALVTAQIMLLIDLNLNDSKATNDYNYTSKNNNSSLITNIH
ncbi:hypothetical protein KO494_10680 [Lacinutrix sp. C3R15]|uniref:hypothetical protein n=1 Tax=Flavobacteriaceae TaxID=49546 RepID=UPI001C080489|nr:MULTISPECIES: hypothetical protein [Flavobacteriaceae]MBU2940004.1 hypothetical protein [Lacinutrix sp. C3R15]MDO6623321.1 hypothetical protein [Oceanihabitans sp. 1_MG-2023]